MSAEYLYGLHAAHMLLSKRPTAVEQLYLLAGRQDERIQELQSLAQKSNCRIQAVPRTELDSLAKGGNHQGVVLACTPAQALPESALPELLATNGPVFFLILDQVQDPHNLGACLRTADAVGVTAVIVPKDRAAGLSAVVRKVACGASETVPLLLATNLARVLRKLQQEGVWLVGLAGEAEQTLYDTDLNGPLALVMGAEGQGLRRLTREHCDSLAKLPMAGSVSSLNVSVAAGVALFEARRQRG